MIKAESPTAKNPSLMAPSAPPKGYGAQLEETLEGMKKLQRGSNGYEATKKDAIELANLQIEVLTKDIKELNECDAKNKRILTPFNKALDPNRIKNLKDHLKVIKNEETRVKLTLQLQNLEKATRDCLSEIQGCIHKEPVDFKGKTVIPLDLIQTKHGQIANLNNLLKTLGASSGKEVLSQKKIVAKPRKGQSSTPEEKMEIEREGRSSQNKEKTDSFRNFTALAKKQEQAENKRTSYCRYISALAIAGIATMVFRYSQANFPG